MKQRGHAANMHATLRKPLVSLPHLRLGHITKCIRLRAFCIPPKFPRFIWELQTPANYNTKSYLLKLNNVVDQYELCHFFCHISASERQYVKLRVIYI